MFRSMKRDYLALLEAEAAQTNAKLEKQKKNKPRLPSPRMTRLLQTL